MSVASRLVIFVYLNADRPHAEVVIDERDRKDYFTPSRTLFNEHCECIVDRYGLRNGLISKESVHDIRYGPNTHMMGEDNVFTVQTDRGIHHARTVVLAVGPGNVPAIPGMSPNQRIDGACHAMQIQQFPDPSVSAKIATGKSTNVMVIGGGLTSAQVADLALRRGVTKVWHILRGGLKGRVDLGS